MWPAGEGFNVYTELSQDRLKASLGEEHDHVGKKKKTGEHKKGIRHEQDPGRHVRPSTPELGYANSSSVCPSSEVFRRKGYRSLDRFSEFGLLRTYTSGDLELGRHFFVSSLI